MHICECCDDAHCTCTIIIIARGHSHTMPQWLIRNGNLLVSISLAVFNFSHCARIRSQTVLCASRSGKYTFRISTLCVCDERKFYCLGPCVCVCVCARCALNEGHFNYMLSIFFNVGVEVKKRWMCLFKMSECLRLCWQFLRLSRFGMTRHDLGPCFAPPSSLRPTEQNDSPWEVILNSTFIHKQNRLRTTTFARTHGTVSHFHHFTRNSIRFNCEVEMSRQCSSVAIQTGIQHIYNILNSYLYFPLNQLFNDLFTLLNSRMIWMLWMLWLLSLWLESHINTCIKNILCISHEPLKLENILKIKEKKKR